MAHSMANVVLYQIGSKSKNPRTNEFYDPWTNHIWLCIEQIRRWNPNVPIYMITNKEEVPYSEGFSKFNVTQEFQEDLPTQHDILLAPYFNEHQNPIYRWGGLRVFFIDSLIKKYGLSDVFTFDNDVLVYCNLDQIGSILSDLYARTAITPDSIHKMVFGMCYIKEADSMTKIIDDMWNIINTDQGKCFSDMDLWNILNKTRGNEFVGILPTWMDGAFSEYSSVIGGIFDPSSIGQHLLGCDNGSAPGCLFPHHYIHRRLTEGNYKFVHQIDAKGRKYIDVLNTSTRSLTKIFSIHVHRKQLKDLMV